MTHYVLELKLTFCKFSSICPLVSIFILKLKLTFHKFGSICRILFNIRYTLRFDYRI